MLHLAIQQPYFTTVYGRIQDHWWRLTGKQAALDAKVSREALAAFEWLSISYACTSQAALYFGGMPLSVLACQGLIVLVAAVLALQLGKYVITRSCHGICRWEPSSLSVAHRVASLNAMNGIGCAGLNIAVHESGHALAAMACFKVIPSITIHPFCGGSTALRLREMTRLGQLIGPHYARVWIILAGIAASLLVGLTEFAIARAYGDSHPRIAQMLNLHAVSQIANEVFYGIESILNPVEYANSDFIRAWQLAGISPVLVTFLLVAIPLVQQVLLLAKPAIADVARVSRS